MSPSHVHAVSTSTSRRVPTAYLPHFISVCLLATLILQCSDMIVYQQISSNGILSSFSFTSFILATQLIIQDYIALKMVNFCLRHLCLLPCQQLQPMSSRSPRLSVRKPVQGIRPRNRDSERKTSSFWNPMLIISFLLDFLRLANIFLPSFQFTSLFFNSMPSSDCFAFSRKINQSSSANTYYIIFRLFI